VNRRAFTAVVRLELLRGRRLLLWGTGAAVLALLGALLLPRGGALFMGVIGLPLVMIIGMAPLGTLASDKLLGHLEFDRTLPVSLRTIAAGRLVGAALRSLPAMLGVMALGVAIANRSTEPRVVGLVLVIAVAAQLLLWWFLWIMLALNARYSLRRLWWLPMSLWLLPTVMPESMQAAIGARIEALGSFLLARMDAPVWLIGVMAAVLVVPTLVLFGGTTLFFAGGLARFRPDPGALGVPLGAAPSRELAAIGRGPTLAIARLRLRLAFEQFRREAIIVVVLLVVVVADIGRLAELAALYLPILAALMPGAVALQLMTGRANGALEGMQHLPHPRRAAALGHLLAVMVMAIPGVLVLALADLAQGGSPDASHLLSRWLWYVTLGWMGAVLAVWATPRRLFAVAATLAVVAMLWWMITAGTPLTDRLLDLGANARRLRAVSGLMLPLAASVVAMVVGTQLFAWGLRSYQGGRGG
jgi:hypothetical protein